MVNPRDIAEKAEGKEDIGDFNIGELMATPCLAPGVIGSVLRLSGTV